MRVPTEPRLKERIGTFMTQALALGSEARGFTFPDSFGMDEIVELANWRFFEVSVRVVFVFDPETGLMRLWALTPEEEEALGEEIRQELDIQAMAPDSHRFLVLYTQPQPGPNEGRVHYGVSVEETFDRDGGEAYEVAVYASPEPLEASDNGIDVTLLITTAKGEA